LFIDQIQEDAGSDPVLLGQKLVRRS